MLGESASPFIDEGDGFTSEGESAYDFDPCYPRRRVHDDGRRPQYYRMSDARGRWCCLLWAWQTSAPTTLLIPEACKGFLPCSSGTKKAGAHNTVDAQRHVGGVLPYGSKWRPQYCRGKCRRLQHCLRSVMSGRSLGTVLQVYRVRSSVLRLT